MAPPTKTRRAAGTTRTPRTAGGAGRFARSGGAAPSGRFGRSGGTPSSSGRRSTPRIGRQAAPPRSKPRMGRVTGRKPQKKSGVAGVVAGILPSGAAAKKAAPSSKTGKIGGIAALTAAAGVAFRNRDKIASLVGGREKSEAATPPPAPSAAPPAPPAPTSEPATPPPGTPPPAA